jgi:DNA repair protein RecO (recombination protein O)
MWNCKPPTPTGAPDMAAEKALALVVRGSDWSETSRITTLFTREFGKVRGLAKGGRRLKSSFDVAFDLLTVCTVVFLRKAHGGLDLLTEAQMVERFPALRRDLPALYAGYYVAELLADGTQDYDPHPPLFDAALDTLRSLGDRRQPDAVSRFELVWLKELGYSPRLDACAGCGAEPLPPGSVRVTFSPTAGGVLCPACGPAAADRRPLTAAGLVALRRLTRAAEDAAGPPPDLGPARGELRQLLGHLVSTVLGRRPRLLGYVDDR